MTRLTVHVDGCDDYTAVEIDVTPAEAEFLHRFAALVNSTSTHSCMPSIRIEETP